MVVVTSFGWSPESGAAGSRYFIVVWSIPFIPKVSKCSPSPPPHPILLLTVLLSDLATDVHVQRQDDNVGKNVHRPHTVQDIRIVEGDLLRDLHHAQNNHDIGTVSHSLLAIFHLASRCVLEFKIKIKKRITFGNSFLSFVN